MFDRDINTPLYDSADQITTLAYKKQYKILCAR